ncbi:GTP cyclohydrolase II [sulfur-oxidizing endosymbiont of Gigantopelta aegis]|uniref:GTP cyclohydrolase II n=1 Tax=sulfur-oxidizing endosymbiont of Gigantopelta aegis TaxID=2794934 RepID=UPI0018DB1230|nr:GTP cyclohydrolase II [sulfur-oxidizing endosymbiont of Gigantopelta aegis]
MALKFVESAKLPTQWAEFTICGYEDEQTGKDHIALVLGDIADGEPVDIRMHSECLTGDAMFSMRCDCGPQLEAALKHIAEAGRGLLLYLRQEGRGIGLINKIKAYHLQDGGADTVEANEQLGFDADLREYDIARDMLEHLQVKQLRLMTNNPKKVSALEELGFDVVERLPWKHGENPHNSHYLSTKAGKLGHMF